MRAVLIGLDFGKGNFATSLDELTERKINHDNEDWNPVGIGVQCCSYFVAGGSGQGGEKMKNLTIRKQLSIGFGLLLFGLIGVVIFSLYQQNLLASLTAAEFEHPFAVTNAVARADANTMRMSRAMISLSTSENETQAQHFISIVNDLEPKVQEDLALGKERFLGNKADFDALIGKFNEWKPI